jgi:cobalt-precorrin 5A hydrolase
MGEAVIVAGIGCRKGAAAGAIEAAIAAALAHCGLAAHALSLIATSSAKRDEGGIAAAASALGVPLVVVPEAALEAAGERTTTKSERVLLHAGVPSLAEAAALAAAGPTARLMAPRVAVGPATCALAESNGHFMVHEPYIDRHES